MDGTQASAADLAEEACDLEINALSRGIGKQDQFMAAFGGLTTLTIAPDGAVRTQAVAIDAEIERAFIAHTHIYYTGLRRDAAVVLSDQNHAMADSASLRHQQVSDSLDQIKELGHRILHAWTSGDLSGWGRMLDEHWQQKKRLGSRISWPGIDALYDAVRARHGVTGGKVIGAGGGGFLMLFCERDGIELQSFMAEEGLPRLDYAIDRCGTKVVYQGGDGS
jgi:D-glycero-alpha-D-manno-heptose-7-phosphate kinase